MEKILIAIKKKINLYDTELGKNLLIKGVDRIEEFKRIQGMSQGLNKAIDIINETIEKYKEGDLDDDK